MNGPSLESFGNFPYTKMLIAKFSRNWPWGLGKKMKLWKVYSETQRLTMNNRQSENLGWAFSSVWLIISSPTMPQFNSRLAQCSLVKRIQDGKKASPRVAETEWWKKQHCGLNISPLNSWLSTKTWQKYDHFFKDILHKYGFTLPHTKLPGYGPDTWNSIE